MTAGKSAAGLGSLGSGLGGASEEGGEVVLLVVENGVGFWEVWWFFEWWAICRSCAFGQTPVFRRRRIRGALWRLGRARYGLEEGDGDEQGGAYGTCDFLIESGTEDDGE